MHDESSQYVLTSEINDQVQRSLIVRQECEDKIARVVEHSSTTEGQDKEAQRDLGFNSRPSGMSQREVCAVWKKGKKNIPLGPPRA